MRDTMDRPGQGVDQFSCLLCPFTAPFTNGTRAVTEQAMAEHYQRHVENGTRVADATRIRDMFLGLTGVSTVTVFVPCELWTLNAERGMHYHRRARLTRAAREAGWAMAKHHKVPRFEQVSVTATPVQLQRGRLADVGGHVPVVKAVVDGLVDAKVLVDDDPEHLIDKRLLPPTRGKCTGIHLRLEGPRA